MNYKCDVCDTGCKYKRQYDEHVITCTLIDKRARDRRENIDLTDDLIPNTRLMFELMKMAMAKCRHMRNVGDRRRCGILARSARSAAALGRLLWR